VTAAGDGVFEQQEIFQQKHHGVVMQEPPATGKDAQEQAGTAVEADAGRNGQVDAQARVPADGEASKVGEDAEDRTENLDAFTVFKRAKNAYFKCEYDRALGYVNYAIGIDPEQREFYHLKVSILNDLPGTSTGSVRTLVAVLEKMIRLDPSEIEAVLQLAQLYEAMKMPTKAAKYWQLARGIDPLHSKVVQKDGQEEETLPGILLREASDLGGKAKLKALEWFDRFKR
jgi:tetratricopeptide (TPR) repeat protein